MAALFGPCYENLYQAIRVASEGLLESCLTGQNSQEECHKPKASRPNGEWRRLAGRAAAGR